MGNVRKNNQDNYICAGEYLKPGVDGTEIPLTGISENGPMSVFGVFDGMGGEERGEIAAWIAAKKASTFSIKKRPAEALIRFCREANEEICKYADENQILSTGTTAAMLAFTKREITLCNIGDSKVFLFADDMLKQLSVDHIAIAPYGRKPPLSQNLGIRPSELIIDPYAASFEYRDGDIFLICSDGLTDMVSQDEIAAILRETDHKAVANLLLKKALENGGKDNITIILCKVCKVCKEKPTLLRRWKGI